jgi:hypothetical protein
MEKQGCMRKNDLRTGVIYSEALHCIYTDTVGWFSRSGGIPNTLGVYFNSSTVSIPQTFRGGFKNAGPIVSNSLDGIFELPNGRESMGKWAYVIF